MAAGVRSVAAAGVPSPARVALRDPGPARGDGGPDGGGAPDPARGVDLPMEVENPTELITVIIL